MPLYEYLCDACGHKFEKIQKFSDSPIEVCPNCGEKQVHKLPSSPAIQFKGTGWYITDYARKNTTGSEGAKSSSEGDAKSAEGKTGGETKSSDAKPAAESKSTPPAPTTSGSKKDS
jgi:putative FmdB family regulatory protein